MRRVDFFKSQLNVSLEGPVQQSYYGEIYASTYDIGGDRPDILSLYLGRWEKAGRPEPVLDAMCGTGYFCPRFLKPALTSMVWMRPNRC